MAKRKTTSQFIEDAIKVHGDRYDYSKVEYLGNNKDVIVICPIHGESKQRPANHLNNGGCFLCGVEKSTKSKLRSKDEFIEECIKTHGDKYDYTITNYVNCKDTIEVSCKNHGVFKVIADNHQRKQGCPKCKKEEIIENQALYFIEKSNKVHKNTYDYTRVIYIDNKSKVEIGCKIHGVFLQRPLNHLAGNGCTECGREKREGKKGSSEEFIKKATKNHGNLYDYNLVNYTNAKNNIIVICKTHGEFLQNPIRHQRGAGCPKCSTAKRAEALVGNTDGFINKSKIIHQNKYDYSLVEYTHSRDKVKIICKDHGVFEQAPVTHLKGSGCQRCASLINIYKKEDYIKLSPIATLYLVLLEYENEKFYKIGKTKNTVQQRLGTNISSYNFEIISEYINSSDIIFDLENELHNKYFKYKYKPQNWFAGYTECYSLSLPIEEIINLNNN